MDSSIKTRRSRICQQLRALLRDQPQVLSLPACRLLGELAAVRATDDGERRGIVEDAALVLDELVEEGQLSDERANALWLALAGCAKSETGRTSRLECPLRPDVARAPLVAFVDRVLEPHQTGSKRGITWISHPKTTYSSGDLRSGTVVADFSQA